MARSAESTTEANASASGTASISATGTAEAAGNQDSVGEGADMPAVETRLIKQVELLLRESGNPEPFDASAWVERWLHRSNHALGGVAPELYLHTPQGEALLSNLIGAMAAGSYM
ncbi:MAG: MbcA/ParS/Xre antitoxin family protein [Cyanobacteria bacterium]|nr:MbcA/ParS/Xre antitoxin family protein [Cyanobacteriota bacterium]